MGMQLSVVDAESQDRQKDGDHQRRADPVFQSYLAIRGFEHCTTSLSFITSRKGARRSKGERGVKRIPKEAERKPKDGLVSQLLLSSVSGSATKR